MFEFNEHHENNNCGLRTKSYIVPYLITLHENAGKHRNELAEQDKQKHFFVKIQDFSLKLFIDNLSDSSLFIEVIVGLLDDIRNEMNHLTFAKIWLFNVCAQCDLFLNLIYFPLEHHGVEIDVGILNLEGLTCLVIMIFVFLIFDHFSESVDDLAHSFVALIIILEVIDCCAKLIWIQSLIF